MPVIIVGTMKVAHVVKTLAVTSIPVEIASAVNDLGTVRSDLIVVDNRSQQRPDTVSKDCVVYFETELDAIKALIKKEQYDLINFHHNVFSDTSRQLLHQLKKERQRPILVNTEHGHRHYSREQKKLNLSSLFLVDGIIFNSVSTEGSYNWLEKLLMLGKPRQVAQLGVNLKMIDDVLSQKPMLTSDAVTLVTAARLIPRKNLQTLLEALSKIENQSVKLKIIGGGRSESELKSLVQSLNLNDRVEFTGQISERARVYQHIVAADIFVMPSFEEGFCVAVAEAMALGLPVVASDIKTLREVVGDGGFYFSPHSSTELSEKITALLSDPGQWPEIGAKNRSRAFENFSLESTATKYVSFYKQLLPGR